jgi:hypothetical protein
MKNIFILAILALSLSLGACTSPGEEAQETQVDVCSSA